MFFWFQDAGNVTECNCVDGERTKEFISLREEFFILYFMLISENTTLQ